MLRSFNLFHFRNLFLIMEFLVNAFWCISLD